jgi:zinc protease
MADFSNAVFQLTTPSAAAAGAGAATSVPSEQDLLQAGVTALKATPEAEKESAALGSLMEKPPAPGTVAEQSVHAPSGVASAWFSNGVLVHHKFMDERKNTVLVRITLAGSELLEDASTRGLTSGAAVGLARTATRSLSSTQVRELMAGKKADVSASASPDAVTLSITASPEDLETGLQLAHLMITEPRIEGPAFEQWQTQRIQGIRAQEKTPMGQMQKAMARTIYPEGEVRVTPLTEAQVAGLTLERSQQWLDTLMAQSPIEVSIVGDIPRERAMELAARYLGSLPSRERISSETHDSRRALQRPKGPRVTDVRVPSQTPQAMVMAGFYGPDVDNVADARAMQLAARIMSTRMVTRVREQEQLVYSIGAQASPGTAYPGFGLFVAGAPTDPAKAQRLGEVLLEMYAQFAEDGPTQEELDVAKKQFANTLDEEMKQPQWWLERTQSATYRGVSLDDVVSLPQAMQAMTTEQVRDVFAKYWATENSVKMTLVPEITPAAEGGAGAPSGGGGAAPKN